MRFPLKEISVWMRPVNAVHGGSCTECVSPGQVDHSTGQQDSQVEGGSLGGKVRKLSVLMAACACPDRPVL